MPAGFTHVTYGDWVYESLSDELKRNIAPYRVYYDLGLHGPDILFFHQLWKQNEVMKLGYRMHFQQARSFFESSREVIKKSKNKGATLAYLLGFINHFVLDSECHGMINQQVRELEISHSELESEFDAYIMKELSLPHTSTRVCEHIKIKELDFSIIADVFAITAKEAKDSVWTMRFVLNTLVCPGKMKRAFVYQIMKLMGKYDEYRGLVFNYEENQKCAEVVRVLRKKMDVALIDSVRLIHEYVATLDLNEILSERFDHDYEGDEHEV